MSSVLAGAVPFVSTLWDSSSSSGHFSCLGAAGRVGGRGSAEGAAGEGREVSPASARETGLEPSASGCHQDAPPLPSRPLCQTTPRVVFLGRKSEPSALSTRLGEQRDRSPCCNTGGVRAPSPKSQIPAPKKRGELVTRSLPSCFSPHSHEKGVVFPTGSWLPPPPITSRCSGTGAAPRDCKQNPKSSGFIPSSLMGTNPRISHPLAEAWRKGVCTPQRCAQGGCTGLGAEL